jgi:hypothetical protein
MVAFVFDKCLSSFISKGYPKILKRAKLMLFLDVIVFFCIVFFLYFLKGIKLSEVLNEIIGPLSILSFFEKIERLLNRLIF